MPTKKQEKELEQQEAKKYLLSVIKAGDVVYTILRHVSQSGMSRNIDVVVIKDNKPICVSWDVAKLLEYRQNEDGSLKVRGCGMDMGYSVVYNMSRTIFDDNYAVNHRWI